MAARTGVRGSWAACSRFITTSWRKRGSAQPHRFERYLQSDAPDFETKAADVMGLYINPPDHAAVFAVDEKTAIQALDRRQLRWTKALPVDWAESPAM